MPDLEEYFKNVQLAQLFKRLGAGKPEILAGTVQHFTFKEGTRRDRIVVDYFGECGINQIVDTVSEFLLAEPQLAKDGRILDVGAGSGFFTAKIAKKVRAKLPNVDWYAMDLTPVMLRSLAKKNAHIAPFLGMAENIRSSIREARTFFRIPYKFDAVFSTLMLHHSLHPEKVFESIKTVLKKNGKAAVLDMFEHDFEEFKAEMGDIHLGFKPESIYEMARKQFAKVKVEKVSGIRCECSGRSTEIFIAKMQDGHR